MNKIKYVMLFFFVFIMSINAHSQRNIVHDLIVSDTMQYLVADYPQEFTWLISAFIFTTISREKPITNGFYMFFIVDSVKVIEQYVSKTKDAELFAKYNPMKVDDRDTCYTIETTNRRKRRDLAIYIHQELEKQLIVSVNVKGKGVYTCESFKP
jgi:hypothetical protein